MGAAGSKADEASDEDSDLGAGGDADTAPKYGGAVTLMRPVCPTWLTGALATWPVLNHPAGRSIGRPRGALWRCTTVERKTHVTSSTNAALSGSPFAASTRRRTPRRVVALSLGGGVIAAGVVLFAPARISTGGTAAGVPEREPVSQLTPVAGSGVGGTARVRPGSGDRASLTITVTGLRPGVIYLAQLYAGPPDAPSASSGRLGELVPDATGRATLTAGEARFGAGGATAPLTFDLLTDGDHSIAVVAPGVGPVASALLQRK